MDDPWEDAHLGPLTLTYLLLYAIVTGLLLSWREWWRR